MIPMKRTPEQPGIHRRLSAICGQNAPARSTVFNWVRGFNSGKGTAPAAVREWHRNTAEE
jgi:hypothetical protein